MRALRAAWAAVLYAIPLYAARLELTSGYRRYTWAEWLDRRGLGPRVPGARDY